ncbi:MAG: B12-binding domain-containing radical SAM protein [Promethearchaeota archaeon]
MNILLVMPPSSFILREFTEISLPDMPLNLAYIAAILEKLGHDVRIIDMNIIKTLTQLKKRIYELEFDIVAFTSTTPAILITYRTIRAFRKVFPRAKIILGGWHVSAVPRQTMDECAEIDYVVMGEGEETISELVQGIKEGSDFSRIKGISFRDADGNVHVNEGRPLIKDIDSLPYPARHLLDLETYKKMGFYTVGGYFKKDLYLSSMITSRGCAFNCTFCADDSIYKGICRLRSPESVVEEIKHVIRNFNIRIFFITDANFTFSQKRVKRICELIIENDLKIIWGCAARVDCVSLELLKLMKKAGCIRISYGIESGSPRILKIMNKRIDLAQVRKAVKMTQDAGIPVYVYFVYGMPGETLDDAKKSGNLLRELKPDYVTHSIAIPFPGSQLYRDAKAGGKLKDATWHDFNYPFSYVKINEDIDKIFKYQAGIIKRYYLSFHFIMKSLKNLKSIYHFMFYMRAIKNLIRFALVFK